MTAQLVRHDITERSETADMIEPTLANDPIANADANDPMLPIESIEPTEPMDKIEPRDPIDNKDRCGMHPSSRSADHCCSAVARTTVELQRSAGRRDGAG